jgi:outer membrane protein OmpA-like peptidoglycan-associated protein
MKKIYLSILIVIVALNSKSQTNLNLYNFKNVGQSNLMNPGIRPQANFTFGLPSLYVSAQTPEITLADIFNKTENADSTFRRIVTDPSISFKNMGVSTVSDLFFIGFGGKKNYYSFGAQLNFDFYGSPPKDVLGLTQGSTFFQNVLNRQANFGNLDINTTSWLGLHGGFTRALTKNLSAGFRVKYLMGLFNANLEQSTLNFSTNIDSIYIKAGFKANTAGIDPIRKDNFDPLAYLQSGNVISGSGWGLDFGLNYKFNQHVSVSGSVVDFGFINWNKNNVTYTLADKEFNYKGADIKDLSTFDSIGTRFEKLLDSLQNEVFVPVESNSSYTTNINTKLYLGAQYAFNYNNTFDFIFFNNFGYKTFNPALSLAFTKKIWSIIDLRVSGTYYNKAFNNAGVGLSLNLGAFQTYFFSDNLIAVMQYDEAKFINVRAGVNWNFGINNDNDGDGIPNKIDKCKNKYGSIELKGCPDKDKDGVTDNEDDCINILGKPCAKGCPDKDNDCVADGKDSCVNDSGSVKLNGCPDKDHDGVTDKLDNCPLDSGRIDLKGCPDADGDKVIDLEDVCPDEYGKKELDGCPDIDNDGVADYQDSCKLIPGLKMFFGCPDIDGDGITDKLDKCPTLKGSKEMYGCPDSDADGLSDIEDNCPNEAGPITNAGCPIAVIDPLPVQTIVLTPEETKVLNEAFSNLEFETGTSNIKESSLESLRELAQLLVVKVEYKLNISGYTDNLGKPASNEKLSASRANAIKNFLIVEGVSKERLIAKGFGSKNPIADNKTAEGRARNRRVEFKIIK